MRNSTVADQTDSSMHTPIVSRNPQDFSVDEGMWANDEALSRDAL